MKINNDIGIVLQVIESHFADMRLCKWPLLYIKSKEDSHPVSAMSFVEAELSCYFFYF